MPGAQFGKRGEAGPVLIVWVFLIAVTNIPYLRAALAPPAGRTFVGCFYYVDDIYSYLSFVQQSEDCAFLFRNKFTLEAHRPALVNLEWWLVGKLSATLGRRPLIAYRLLGVAAALALFLALDRWTWVSPLPTALQPSSSYAQEEGWVGFRWCSTGARRRSTWT